MKVRKAVFPAAGLGTRFLPATKAQPKEMLPNRLQREYVPSWILWRKPRSIPARLSDLGPGGCAPITTRRGDPRAS